MKIPVLILALLVAHNSYSCPSSSSSSSFRLTPAPDLPSFSVASSSIRRSSGGSCARPTSPQVQSSDANDIHTEACPTGGCFARNDYRPLIPALPAMERELEYLRSLDQTGNYQQIHKAVVMLDDIVRRTRVASQE